MRKWERIELGNRFYLDRDSRQWILQREHEVKGKQLFKPLGYYPTLRATIQALATRRLGDTHIEDWQRIVDEIDAVVIRLENKLPAFWRAA